MTLLSANLSVLADAGSVIAIGITVVFLVLLLLTGVFKIFGMVVSSAQGKESQSNSDTPKQEPVTPVAPPKPVEAPIVGNTETVTSKPDVDGGIPAETVAVISAAVGSMAPEGMQYAVKGIRKL